MAIGITGKLLARSGSALGGAGSRLKAALSSPLGAGTAGFLAGDFTGSLFGGSTTPAGDFGEFLSSPIGLLTGLIIALAAFIGISEVT